MTNAVCVKFIAMEYYGLILNRTYEICACQNRLTGIRISGLISASTAYRNSIFRNPDSFRNSRLVKRYEGQDTCSKEALSLDRANFFLDFSKITKIEFSPRRKWGMASVPHSGILIIWGGNKVLRELILLGSQDGQLLASRLSAAVFGDRRKLEELSLIASRPSEKNYVLPDGWGKIVILILCALMILIPIAYKYFVSPAQKAAVVRFLQER